MIPSNYRDTPLLAAFPGRVVSKLTLIPRPTELLVETNRPGNEATPILEPTVSLNFLFHFVYCGA